MYLLIAGDCEIYLLVVFCRPFYGYHKAEHQFLRIQLYNPNLLRRMSNMLGSGLILGKQFQPHEAHIPYILKFFIDYNLFGMSFLHIPLQFVHTRSQDNTRHKKRSVSQLEVDFKAIYILNRLAGVEEEISTKAANPGIESIWEDERIRRSAMDSDAVPSLESAVTQIRECLPTESDVFFRTILNNKLAQKSNESTMNLTSSNEIISPIVNRKFNLKNLLDSSVYAAEYSQNSFTSKSSQASQVISSDPSQNDSIASQTIQALENQFLNYSEPSDAEMQSRDDEEIFEILEEYPEDEREDDSVLAPLSQFSADETLKLNPSMTQKLSPIIDECNEMSLDSDDEMFNELNVTVADMEIFSQYVNDEHKNEFPQLDGVDDELEKLSHNEVTRRNDENRNFHPQAGPSHLYISPIQVPLKQESSSNSSDILNCQEIQNNLKQLVNHFQTSPVSVLAKLDPSQSSDDDDDDLISSFYNKTMMDDDFLSLSDDDDEVVKQEIHKESIVITPAVEPPDPSIVLDQLSTFHIPQYVHPQPFYSNPKDVTGKKEVGHTVLDIPGKRLRDLEEFESILLERKTSVVSSRFKLLNKTIVVCLKDDPPSYNDASSWLKSKSSEPEDESPIKEKFGKTLMVIEADDEILEDMDTTLKPSTPTTPDIVLSSQEKDPVSLSQYVEEKLHLRSRRRRHKMKKSFSKRFQEIMKAKAAAEVSSLSPDLRDVPGEEVDSEETIKTSRSSSSSATKSSDQNSSIFVQNANIQEDLSFNNCSDITGPSPNNTCGFKMKLESLQSNNEHTDLTILSMELHVQTRNELKPNPEFDAISAIFYCLDGYSSASEMKNFSGIIACVNDSNFRYIKSGVDVFLVKTEMEILETFFKKIREFDPDIFAGYEIETASWGYLVQRGYVYSMNLNNALSRMPTEKAEKAVIDEEDHLDVGDYYSEQKIPGRILLDVWRLMRHEIALTSYTFENICYHVLHRR